MTKNTISFLTIVFAVLLSSVSYADEQQEATEAGHFFGNLRAGYINSADEVNDRASSSALGGYLGYVSNNWRGVSAGATLFATQKLFNDENGDFFGSDGESYAIVGEAYLQGNFGRTEIKAGRFEFDSPYADTDDIRMIPNTFSGAALINSDFEDTTIYAAYLDKWSGVDSDIPEDFTELNDGEGIFSVGAIYEGINDLGLQAWYYHGNDYADLAYVDAMYAMGNFVVGAQLALQNNDTADNSGPDGNLFGIMAHYTFDDFNFSAAYNGVSGTVTNGFGGGPFFTSSGDHTIADVEDQKAIAAGAYYNGIDNLILSILHVNFEKGENETDLLIEYQHNPHLNFEVMYINMYDDGDIFLVRANIGF